MTLKCCVPTCNKTQEDVPLHRLPCLYQDLYDVWLKRIGRSDLTLQDPSVVYTKQRVCDLHFTEECRLRSQNRQFIGLKGRSLPTVNVPGFNEKPTKENSFLEISKREPTLPTNMKKIEIHAVHGAVATKESTVPAIKKTYGKLKKVNTIPQEYALNSLETDTSDVFVIDDDFRESPSMQPDFAIFPTAGDMTNQVSVKTVPGLTATAPVVKVTPTKSILVSKASVLKASTTVNTTVIPMSSLQASKAPVLKVGTTVNNVIPTSSIQPSKAPVNAVKATVGLSFLKQSIRSSWAASNISKIVSTTNSVKSSTPSTGSVDADTSPVNTAESNVATTPLRMALADTNSQKNILNYTSTTLSVVDPMEISTVKVTPDLKNATPNETSYTLSELLDQRKQFSPAVKRRKVHNGRYRQRLIDEEHAVNVELTTLRRDYLKLKMICLRKQHTLDIARLEADMGRSRERFEAEMSRAREAHVLAIEHTNERHRLEIEQLKGKLKEVSKMS